MNDCGPKQSKSPLVFVPFLLNGILKGKFMLIIESLETRIEVERLKDKFPARLWEPLDKTHLHSSSSSSQVIYFSFYFVSHPDGREQIFFVSLLFPPPGKRRVSF